MYWRDKNQRNLCSPPSKGAITRVLWFNYERIAFLELPPLQGWVAC